MIYWLVKFINTYRQYVIFTILILFSLFLLSLNNTKEITTIRKASFLLYGLIDYLKKPFDDFLFYKSENEALRKENADLTRQLFELKKFENERSELYDLLNFKEKNFGEFIAARIILKTSDVIGNKIIIDKGSRQGVKLNSIVINPNGLIGYVSDLSREFSVVHTIKNNNMRISVVNERTDAIGILSWDGEKFKVYNVNKSSDVKEGDVFLTSQFSTQFPSGIPVVKVTYASRESETLFYDITGRSITNLDKISYCMILKPEHFNNKLNFISAK